MLVVCVAEGRSSGCGELAWASRRKRALLVQTGRTELVSWTKVMGNRKKNQSQSKMVFKKRKASGRMLMGMGDGRISWSGGGADDLKVSWSWGESGGGGVMKSSQRSYLG